MALVLQMTICVSFFSAFAASLNAQPRRRPPRVPRNARPAFGAAESATRTAAKAVVANLSAAYAGTNGPAPDALIPVTAEGSTDANLADQVHRRFDQDAVARSRQREFDAAAPQPELPADQPRAMADIVYYGLLYGQPGPTRFLALHLLVENPTDEAVVIPRGEIAAKIDDEKKPLEDVPDTLKHIGFPYGSQHHNVQSTEPLKEIKVPAKGVAGTWLLFHGLPMTTDVPAIELDVTIGRRALRVDVTASQRALLGLRSETMGPHDCLRVLTIHGLLNTVNLQSLVKELESATDRKVVRFVLQFAEGAPPPDHQMSYWLINSGSQPGFGRPANDQFPSFPALVREFHLVQPAGNQFPGADQYGRPVSGLRMHVALADAVSAALKSSFISLSPDELIAAIRSGAPLARAAALRHGAGKLNAAHLPVVLKLIDDSNADIQAASIRALNQFGEPAALDALVRLADEKDQRLAVAAIESLASSRYSAAHAALLRILRKDDAGLKKQIMPVLGRYPRPLWSDTIYAYVTDPKEQLPIEGVRALLQVGHPRLTEVLEAALSSSDKAVRDLVFPILAMRSDPRSERLATDYALKQLAEQPPDGTVIQFLYRTKLPQAVPLLLQHLDAAADKGSIINLLAQIGDDSVGDAIVAKYERLQNHERSTAITALRILQHEKFRPLAGEALLSSDGGLVSQATQALIQDGSPEACRLLIAALDKQANNYAISNICNALANTGLPEARAALLKARESDNQEKKSYAINALNYLRQRSPGYQYIWQAQAHSQQKQWNDALEYFDLALQLDPELPEAYAGRGSMKLRLGKTKEAVSDFEKAYELDPYNAQAISGLAVLRVQDGKIEEGLKLIEGNRERHQHDAAYLYNSACAYAQATEQIVKTELADREQLREEYRKKAISELQGAIAHGFADYDWIREDPDFQPLAEDAEFRKIVGNRPAPKDQPADAAPES